jgi:NAD-dependent SIR2 family protein deacetylase
MGNWVASPQKLKEMQLEEVIKNDNFLFYTGAGLSLASDVPAMSDLNKLLGLEEGELFLFSLEKALNNPREFASKILIFHNACLYSAPTPAHIALKELAIFKNIRIVTENLDCLHERTGIYPYRINVKELRDEIGGASVLYFDYIICIGLSFDDRGFLGWYKEQNPNGKIIAIDLMQPSYLGDEDFLLNGNLQEILPSIQKNLHL